MDINSEALELKYESSVPDGLFHVQISMTHESWTLGY